MDAESWLLVPGAGIEPARTLADPRDFKTHPSCTYQSLSHDTTRNQRVSLSRGVPSVRVGANGSGTQQAHLIGLDQANAIYPAQAGEDGKHLGLSQATTERIVWGRVVITEASFFDFIGARQWF